MTAADVISAEQRYLLQTYARPEFVIERGEA
jgi:acetylornithine/N-succinyldiaminopimelate aminotransferase